MAERSFNAFGNPVVAGLLALVLLAMVGAGASVWFAGSESRGVQAYAAEAQRVGMLAQEVAKHAEAAAGGTQVALAALAQARLALATGDVPIGAVVLDGARICQNAWVAAGALVPPGMSVEPGTLVAGVPARVVRPLSQEEIERQRNLTLLYVATAQGHSKGLPLEGR